MTFDITQHRPCDIRPMFEITQLRSQRWTWPLTTADLHILLGKPAPRYIVPKFSKNYYTPAPPKVEWGVYWIHPDVCPSVRPSVEWFPELFEKTIGSIHFIPGIYPYGVSPLTPIHFRVPSLIFGPLVAKYLVENGVSGTFWKNGWLNSFHTWHLSLWGESLDPCTFSCS